jgi:hypothetical protein
VKSWESEIGGMTSAMATPLEGEGDLGESGAERSWEVVERSWEVVERSWEVVERSCGCVGRWAATTWWMRVQMTSRNGSNSLVEVEIGLLGVSFRVSFHVQVGG